MFPAPFEYHDPVTIDETLALLARHRADARPLAGGQSLVAAMNLGIARPAVVVDLQRVAGLAHIEVLEEGLVIGAMVRQVELLRSEAVRRRCPLLAEAVGLVGNARVRARGTLGGSLAHADPFAELPAVLLTLDGALRTRSTRGGRTIPADRFFVAPLTNTLEPDELLIDIYIPPAPPGAGVAIEELNRRPGDFAIAGAAALVVLDADGRCADARLTCFGSGPSLVRLAELETALRGERLSDARIEATVRGLSGATAYDERMLALVAARALARARDRAAAPEGARR
jgi:CO/xanthine dehydrogenase FAD-binding subunit